MKKVVLLLIGLLVATIFASIGISAQDPSPTPSLTPTPSPTPSPSLTPTPSPSPTPSTPSPTPSPTPTPTPTLTGFISIITTPINGTVTIYAGEGENKDKVGGGVTPYNGEFVVGVYTISFGEIEGYKTPEDVVITVEANKTTPVERVYIEKRRYTIKIEPENEKADVWINGERKKEGTYYEGTNLTITFGKVIEDLICYIPENERINEVIDSNKTIIMRYKKAPTATLEITTVSVTEGRKRIDGEIYINNDFKGRGFWSGECWIGLTPVISFGSSPEFYNDDISKPKYDLRTSSIPVRDLKEGEIRKIEGEYIKKNYKPEVEIISPPEGGIACLDERIELIGRGSDPDGGSVECLWSVEREDGLMEKIERGRDVFYKFESAGRHIITLTVIDDEGSSNSKSVNVNVVIKPVISLNLDPQLIVAPEEKSTLTITIKTLHKDPPTVVQINEIICDEGITGIGNYEKDICTPVLVSGDAPVETKTAYIGAITGGTYSIKVKGYYWLEGSSNKIPIESNAVSLKAQVRGPKPTPKPKTPGFEIVFTIMGLLAVAYLVGRRNK